MPTTTPIQPIVVILQQNRSSDRYFASNPVAANLAGEPPFYARPKTPSVNGLLTAGLLTSNPNSANPMPWPGYERDVRLHPRAAGAPLILDPNTGEVTESHDQNNIKASNQAGFFRGPNPENYHPDALMAPESTGFAPCLLRQSKDAGHGLAIACGKDFRSRLHADRWSDDELRGVSDLPCFHNPEPGHHDKDGSW